MEEDIRVDVCISHPGAAGVRQKHHFTSGRALVDTLRAWTGAGIQDILLTWGSTQPAAVARLERILRGARVAYTVPRRRPRPAPGRGRLSAGFLLVVLAFILGPAGFLGGLLAGEQAYEMLWPRPAGEAAFRRWLEGLRSFPLLCGFGFAAVPFLGLLAAARRLLKSRPA
jgi:hypothetical protein